eukprot:13163609-Ditylum_brightwellii.AAC.1
MECKYGERWWRDLSKNRIPLHAWWMVRASSTTSKATALCWGAYMPMPLSESGMVAMTKEWWGSCGAFARDCRTLFVTGFIRRET